MPAPLGNKSGLKIKDPDLRQDAYKKYCDWLALGKSSRAFTYEHELLLCTGKTIESYIKNDPVEFPPIQKDVAFSKGYLIWESVAEASATGENKDANTASLQMIMRNKYGWDKKEAETVKPLDYVSILCGVEAISTDTPSEEA